jgi:septal ring factor EnvC (AmiA/AmiB activator)
VSLEADMDSRELQALLQHTVSRLDKSRGEVRQLKKEMSSLRAAMETMKKEAAARHEELLQLVESRSFGGETHGGTAAYREMVRRIGEMVGGES